LREQVIGGRPPSGCTILTGMRPFRFLADVHEIVTGAELAARARRAEQTGYHSVVIPDHLLGQLSPVVALATVAAATSTLRVSAFVMNNDLRHPAVVAQDLASIDVLSGGRVDVAIGAGWNKPEYDAIGIAFDSTAVRQARLAESITVLKGLFSGSPFSFAGEHERYEAGDSYLTVDVDGLRVTLFVCYDLRFADEFWACARDTDLYVVPANWPEPRREHWRTLLRARAIENQAYVVGVNRVGAVKNLVHVGDSVILDPLGRVLAEAGPDETVLSAEVDAATVAAVRREFPFLVDRRTTG